MTDTEAHTQEIPAAELRAFVTAHAPAYMVPGVYIHHQAFERTGTGKVIRNRLPHPSAAGRVMGKADKPQTPAELALAGIWRDLLEVPEFGRDEDFFDLGGDSLQAMAMLVALAACSPGVSFQEAGERAADRTHERSFSTRNNR